MIALLHWATFLLALGMWPFWAGWVLGKQRRERIEGELMRARQLLYENGIDYEPDEKITPHEQRAGAIIDFLFPHVTHL